MKNRKWVRAVAVGLMTWLIMAWSDYAQVRDFELPTYCVLTNGTDDGGSGTYVGLGYSFEIEGNFLPEDEYPGVTQYTYKILGLNVVSAIRD